MKNKEQRHDAIKKIISTFTIGNQDDLLKALINKGFSLTQATLSRDLKTMKVVKQANEEGNYIYFLPNEIGVEQSQSKEKSIDLSNNLSIHFSGNLAVLKTRPGYASSIATDIDGENTTNIIGTIAGDDTILLVLKESVVKETIIDEIVHILEKNEKG